MSRKRIRRTNIHRKLRINPRRNMKKKKLNKNAEEFPNTSRRPGPGR